MNILTEQDRQQIIETATAAYVDASDISLCDALIIQTQATMLDKLTPALEAAVQRACEVMRERCESMLRYQGGFNIDLVRALPGVTMEDLK